MTRTSIIPSRLSFLLGDKSSQIGLLIFTALIMLVLPLSLDIFRLNLFGKYLTYAFVAVGLVLCWGMGGILSLGQGVFFGLGGYCMAMYLKLEASDPITTAKQSTPGIPDFMDWNQITQLPLFWKPFYSLPFTLAAIVVVPTCSPSSSARRCSNGGSAASISPSSPRSSPPSCPF